MDDNNKVGIMIGLIIFTSGFISCFISCFIHYCNRDEVDNQIAYVSLV